MSTVEACRGSSLQKIESGSIEIKKTVACEVHTLLSYFTSKSLIRAYLKSEMTDLFGVGGLPVEAGGSC